MTNEPSITLATLQAILSRETSVIAPEDVWLLMDQARLAAGNLPTVADRVTDWDITATAERFNPPANGVQAWKVTLTHGFNKITVTMLTALGAGEPTAADGLREVRRDTARDEYSEGAGDVLAWLGEQRYDALMHDTKLDDTNE